MLIFAAIPTIAVALGVLWLAQQQKAREGESWQRYLILTTRLHETYLGQVRSQRERIDELTKRLARALGRPDPAEEPTGPEHLEPRRPRVRELWRATSAEDFLERPEQAGE